MRLVGLYGHPISHSLSPVMHNYVFEKLCLPYFYQAFDITPELLNQAVAAIRVLNMAGVNVTIPHKETVIPYLDVLDESAEKIGAVNTIINQNGILKGYNTDGLGYVMSLEKEMQIQVAGAKILVIGSGGAARGIAYALMKSGCNQLDILSRNKHKASIIVSDFQELGNIKHFEYDPVVMRKFDVIINTTPVGMYPNVNDLPIDVEWIHKGQIVSDVVYNPLETKLLQEAKNRGAKIHKGLGMFIYQGALSLEKWTGHQAPAEEMYDVIYKKLKNK